MAFSSTAKGTNRFSDTNDEHAYGRDRRNVSDRFGRDRDGDRPRERNGFLGTKNGDDDADGWQTARPRKSFGQEDGDRWQRNGDRNRERYSRNADGDRENRRHGEGRERTDRRWNRDEHSMTTGDGEGRDNERTGGWRDRDRDRDRDRPRRDDREWARGGTARYDTRADDVPEWMDEPVNESKQAKNVNDFEAWKAQQKAKQAGKSDEVELPSATKSAEETKATALLGLSGKGLFGMYGESKKPEVEPANGNATIKPTAKAKASKFADFFSKDDEPVEVQQPVPAASPPPAAGPSNEADKEGFNRILALLGKSNISSPPPLPGSAPPQQMRPPPPDMRSPDVEKPSAQRLQNHLEDQNPAHGLPQQLRREQFSSPSQDFGPFPAVRNGATTAPNDKENPFRAPEPQRKSQMDENHAFLLNLMQSRAPQQQQAIGPISPSTEYNQSFVFPEKSGRAHVQDQQQQQARLREEQATRELQARMRGVPPSFPGEGPNGGMMFESEQQRIRGVDRSRNEPGRKPSQRMAGPPGFFEDPAIAGLQRRPTDNTGRPQQPPQQSHNMPRQMPQHPEEFLKMALPPSMQRPPQGQEPVGPPPGFGAGLPPGFTGGIPPGFGPPPPAGAPPPQGRPIQQQPPPQQRTQGIPGMFPHAPNMMPPPPPPPGGPQGPPPGAGFFSPGSGVPPGFGRPAGNPGMHPLPPGMAMPPHGQRPPMDLMSEMQQHNGGRGGMGPYGL